MKRAGEKSGKGDRSTGGCKARESRKGMRNRECVSDKNIALSGGLKSRERNKERGRSQRQHALENAWIEELVVRLTFSDADHVSSYFHLSGWDSLSKVPYP